MPQLYNRSRFHGQHQAWLRKVTDTGITLKTGSIMDYTLFDDIPVVHKMTTYPMLYHIASLVRMTDAVCTGLS